MQHAGINYLAVLVAAAAAWVAGAVYYGVLSQSWIAALGKAKETLMPNGRPTTPTFILSFVCEFVMAFVLAGAIGHLGPGQVTFKNGVISALILWGGFILTTFAASYAYAHNKPRLLAIDAGHWLIVMVIMGAIIGAWG